MTRACCQRNIRNIVAQNTDRFDPVDKVWRIDDAHWCGFLNNHQMRFVNAGQRNDANDSARYSNAFDVVHRRKVPSWVVNYLDHYVSYEQSIYVALNESYFTQPYIHPKSGCPCVTHKTPQFIHHALEYKNKLPISHNSQIAFFPQSFHIKHNYNQ